MPRILYRDLRFRIIDRCLRDSHTQHTIASLTEACNRTLTASYGVRVSRRTVQYDISILRNTPYNIELNQTLLRQGIYRYADINCTVDFLADSHNATPPRETLCTIKIKEHALPEFEQIVFQMGNNIEVVAPSHLRQKIKTRLQSTIEKYERTE